jgi:hypothetical protein
MKMVPWTAVSWYLNACFDLSFSSATSAAMAAAISLGPSSLAAAASSPLAGSSFW